MEKIIFEEMRNELLKHVDEEYKIGCKNAFKEEIYPMGVRANNIRMISNTIFIKFIKPLKKEELFKILDFILCNGMHEEQQAVIYMLSKLNKKYEKDYLKTFLSYLEKYVTNWAHCDSLSTKVIGELFLKFPEEKEVVLKMVKSDNRWVRRSAYVSLIPLAKKDKKAIEFILNFSKNIFKEKDDLVLKGSGWLLKELSENAEEEVFNFLYANKEFLPKLVIRMALELMPSKKSIFIKPKS